MGTDNLFHKRKARAAEALKRKRNQKDRYEKILIVTEGEKTEPFYFEGAREFYELNTANVEVTGESDSAPSQILKHAKKLFREEKDAGDPFDRVFCVFDRDTHACYDRTCADINAISPKETFFAIKSVPSFEYWVLLHFIYKASPFHGQDGNSAGKQVIDELKKYMPDYEKGRKGLFYELSDQLPNALKWSESILNASRKHGEENPSTNVHELVQVLRDIKKDN